MSCPDDDQATRVMNPTARSMEAVLGGSASAPNETVVLSPSRPAEDGFANAEFVPTEGMIDMSDPTVMWRPAEGAGARALVAGLRRRLKGLTKRHLIGGVMVLVVLVLGLLLPTGPGAGAVSKTGPGSKEQLEAEQPGASQSVRNASDVGLSPFPKGLPPTPLLPVGGENGLTLRVAAEALLDGRLEEARRCYRQLSDIYPQDRSYRLAAEILDHTSPGRSK
jgi:hypothetical protein